MKPNPEQDADRAAFERLAMTMGWPVVHMGGHYYDSEVECAWIAYQSALYIEACAVNLKSDSHILNEALDSSLQTNQVMGKKLVAMQDAFEQVCVVLEQSTGAIEEVRKQRAVPVADDDYVFHFITKWKQALSLVAPFRKTGV